ncbi:hypothetical protein AB0I10_22090 [Streptomyces sp. NPDC050636]|uniref:hypothetical protein n=1 Tax=Streptomyces sp. NPDC050636 TaxID=3154510 RepID=UPI0034249472
MALPPGPQFGRARETSDVYAHATAAAGCTTALYSETHPLRAWRADGTQASQQNGLTFHAGKQYATCQYPPPRAAEELPQATVGPSQCLVQEQKPAG